MGKKRSKRDDGQRYYVGAYPVHDHALNKVKLDVLIAGGSGFRGKRCEGSAALSRSEALLLGLRLIEEAIELMAV